MKKGIGLRALGIIHKAMLVGQILFAGIVFYMIYAKMAMPSLAEQDKIFQLIAIALAAVAVFAGSALFKKKIQIIRSMYSDINKKFAVYRSACITQWALIEGACIFSLISFFLIGNYAFLALAGFLIVFFTLQAPAKNKAMLHLGVSEAEVDAL